MLIKSRYMYISCINRTSLNFIDKSLCSACSGQLLRRRCVSTLFMKVKCLVASRRVFLSRDMTCDSWRRAKLPNSRLRAAKLCNIGSSQTLRELLQSFSSFSAPIHPLRSRGPGVLPLCTNHVRCETDISCDLNTFSPA